MIGQDLAAAGALSMLAGAAEAAAHRIESFVEGVAVELITLRPAELGGTSKLPRSS